MEVIYVSVPVFLLVFGTFVADADGVNADDMAASAESCVTPVVSGMGAGCTPVFVCIKFKGKLSPPRSTARGGLSGEGTASCPCEMIYWKETQSQLL